MEETGTNIYHSNIALDFLQTVFGFVWALITSAVENLVSLCWFLPCRYKVITDDTVLITGGGKGIGRLLAIEFAKHRPKQIILWGRHADTLANTAKIVESHGVSCDFMVCDVGDYHSVYTQAERVRQKYGGISILVNNAGVVYGNDLEFSKPAETKKAIEVNTLAHFWTVKCFMSDMLEKNRGHLVFINSILGLMPLPGATEYSASKYGAVGLSDSLLFELWNQGKTGVRVTSVHPYVIDTDMFAGCAIRFPKLFPPLTKEYVAWKTIDAVLTNQHCIVMPRLLYFTYLLKCVLPARALYPLYKFSGVNRTMDTFHGRKQKKL